MIYGQTEIVKDLIAARLETGRPLLFEVSDVAVSDLGTGRPRVTFTHEGAAQELECDVIAGCDGFHGVCRPSIPAGVLTEFSREYPFGWLGILAAVAPSIDEVVYSAHERGFALLSPARPRSSRATTSSARRTTTPSVGRTSRSGQSSRSASGSRAGRSRKVPCWRRA